MSSVAAEQAPADASQLPPRKRKHEDEDAVAPPGTSSEPTALLPKSSFQSAQKGPVSKARSIRLEQNRKAARESRRRKKVMIEELQRSVIFFSRANGTLKQQNDELSRILMQAQAQVAAIENNKAAPTPVAAPTPMDSTSFQQQAQQANTVATQAVYESQGFPPAAARAAAQTVNGTAASAPLPPMQPGATMQAMANFQQAAAVAMQAAVQGLGGVPAPQAAAAAATTSYQDTLAAMAMQQAAAAAAAGLANPWSQQQPAAQAPSSTNNNNSTEV